MIALTPYGRKCLASFIDNQTDGNNGVYMECIGTAYELAGLYLLRYMPDELPKELERTYVNNINNKFLILDNRNRVHITYKQLEEELKKCYISDMELLAILENYRIFVKPFSDVKAVNCDSAIRLCTAFIAGFFGYDNRKDWTSVLAREKLVDYEHQLPDEADKQYKKLASKLDLRNI